MNSKGKVEAVRRIVKSAWGGKVDIEDLEEVSECKNKIAKVFQGNYRLVKPI